MVFVAHVDRSLVASKTQLQDTLAGSQVIVCDSDGTTDVVACVFHHVLEADCSWFEELGEHYVEVPILGTGIVCDPDVSFQFVQFNIPAIDHDGGPFLLDDILKVDMTDVLFQHLDDSAEKNLIRPWPLFGGPQLCFYRGLNLFR